jgi:bicarbonate transport system ATP-binding protein
LGLADLSYARTGIKLFDGTTFDADDPISYLNNLEIKRNVTMAEIALTTPRKVA